MTERVLAQRGPAARQHRKRANSYDVAQLAGVSQSAVSRVFTPGGYASEEVRRRVLEAARRLNFRPNAIARSLTTNRSRIVGIVVPALANPTYPLVLEAFSRALHRHGRQSLLLTGFEDPKEAVQQIVQYQCDGVVITAATRLAPAAEIALQCQALQVPVVLFNRQLVPVLPAVLCRNAEGGRRAAEVLIAAGHRQLAVIAGPEETTANAARRDAFRARVAEAGLPTPVLALGAYSYDEGRRALLQLMRDAPRPDALFCTSDVMALGALDAARHDLGLLVPRDLSIVGFDDVPMAAWSSYRLTTFRPRFEEMVAAATALLLSGVTRTGPDSPVIEVDADLVVRDTVRRAG